MNKNVHMATFLLLAVGGLNWLLTGLFTNWDLASLISVNGARVVYILIGLSAVYELATHKKHCSSCGSGGSSQSAPDAQGGGM